MPLMQTKSPISKKKATLGVVVLMLLALWPALVDAPAGGQLTPDSAVDGNSYTAEFTVDPEGGIRVEKHLNVDFRERRRGIYEYVNVQNPIVRGGRYYPRDYSVARNRGRTDYSVMWSNDRGSKIVRVGNPNIFLQGTQEYDIAYSVDRALVDMSDARDHFGERTWLPQDNDGSVLYWQLVPEGYAYGFDEVNLTVNLPMSTKGAVCRMGVDSDQACELSGDGTDTLTITATDLRAGQPINLFAPLEMEAPAQGTRLWTLQWDRVLGYSTIGLLGTLALAALAFLVGRLMARATHEKEPQFPLLYENPQDLTPAQAHYIFAEQPGEHDLMATILYAAELGVIKVEPISREQWRIVHVASPDHVASIPPSVRSTLEALGLVQQGDTFENNSRSAWSQRKVQNANDQLYRETLHWAGFGGMLKRDNAGALGATMVVLGLVLMALLVFLLLAGYTMAALVPAAFILGARPLLEVHTQTRRTRAGREAWSRAGSVHRLVATDSAVDRYEFAARKNLYTSFLPYAVAFGVAEQWAKKYELNVGTEPPAPRWFDSAGTGIFWDLYMLNTVNNYIAMDIMQSFNDVATSNLDWGDVMDTIGSSGFGGFGGGSGGGFGGGGFGGFSGGGGGGGGGGSW